MTKAKKTTTKIEEAPKKSPQATKTPAGQATSGADLSIADLKNLATIIDVASTRGAFRANEMATVGVMFNKLQAFLAKVAPQETKPENAPATAEAKK
jgi:hypothetical protein